MRFAKAYVEITNICNLSCAFCPKTKRAPRQMTPAEFELLAARLRPYTDFLYFHVMGEPLLHPQLDALLSLAAARGFRVILTTNGTLLPQRVALLCTSEAVHKVNISLHSFEANSGVDMERYLRGCLDFAERAAAAGKLINLRLWNLDGSAAPGLHEKNDTVLHQIRAHFPQPWTDARGGMKLAQRVYLSYGERFDWPSLAAADYGERRFCYGLKDQLGVLVDGTVIPCCLDSEGSIALGNLFSQDLDEILSSERAKAILEGFRQNRAVESLCRRCQYSTRFFR